ncbi:hypothetical protein EJ063_11010 [Vibrio aquaticus]|uniref:Porin n=1 Tax=Vibrio aquaticus TaxID=2496559 RepID=A0A432CV58_9VIBR|nr:hypothetical protein [Vibrio aquaticus]RTZ15599.1 hypothetical protein EJ063_11010 [Vibrio aquaticus]
MIYRHLVCVLSCALFTPFTLANDSLSPWSFSGFGTLGYSYENQDNIAFIRDFSKPLDIDQSGSWLTDSQLGAQISYRSSPYWDMTAQVVATDYIEYEPIDSLEWAYLALHPTQSLDVRLGRMGIDIFSLSDTRRVDYAHIWVRPPAETYGWIPLYSVDGIDATYHFETDNTFWRLKAQYGSSQSKSMMMEGSSIYHFEGDDLFALSLTAEHGDWTLRSSAARVTIGTPLPNEAQLVKDTLDYIASLGPSMVPTNVSQQANDLSNQIDILGKSINYFQLSATFDNYDWLVAGELAYSHSQARIMPNGLGGYITVAKRFNEFTPFAGYSLFKANDPAYQADEQWENIHPDLARLGAASAEIINAGRIEQQSSSIGVRWDFYRQAALTLQWDHFIISENGSGMWAGVGKGRDKENTVDLFSASIAFVF